MKLTERDVYTRSRMSRKEMSDALVDAEKDVDKVWNAVEKNAINHREFPEFEPGHAELDYLKTDLGDAAFSLLKSKQIVTRKDTMSRQKSDPYHSRLDAAAAAAQNENRTIKITVGDLKKLVREATGS